MDNDWKSRLRDKMSGYSEPEPQGLWEGIMHQMDMQDAKKAVPQKSRLRRVIPAILIPSAVAASVALAVFLKPAPENAPVSSPDTGLTAEADSQAQIQIEKPAPQVDESVYGLLAHADIKDSNGSHAAPAGPDAASAHHQGKTEPAKGTSESRSEDTGVMAEENGAQDAKPGSKPLSADKTAEGDTVTDDSSRTQGTVDHKNEKSPHKSLSQEEMMQDYNTLFQDIKKREGGKISTDIYVSNLAGSSQKYSGYGTYQPEALSFKGIPAPEAMSGSPGNGVMLMTQEELSDTEIRHRQPVRAGVNFRYSFTRRWSLETGLVYSYLSSSMDSGNGSRYSSATEQDLHYIGIPLKAGFSFLDTRHITLYASAGGMIEKCISGKVTTEYSINGREISSTVDKVKIKPVQWSLLADVGLQWNITSLLGLYLEPGISWHFDNGSLVNTIYKEKPLNFNLEFGIRFSFD